MSNPREIFVSWQGDQSACQFVKTHPVAMHGLAPGMTINLSEPEARRLVQGLLNILNGGHEISPLERLATAAKNLAEHAKESHPHFESPRGQADIGAVLVAIELAGGAK